jgi:hypothetical protein
MARIIAAFTQFFDDNGDPLVDGWLKFNESGTNNTDKNTFADINETIPNANPLQLDGAGRCPNVFGTGAYNIISYQDNGGVPGTQIQQFDPVSGDVTGVAFADWDAETIYSVGDIVTGSDGNYYRSLSSNNQNQDPTISPGQWEEVTLNQIWNTNVIYSSGDTVYGSDGELYISKTDANTGNNPTSDQANWRAFSLNNIPDLLENLGFTATVATKALTFAIKTRLLTNPTATDKVNIAYRSETLTTGDFDIVSFSAAASIVVPDGATLGFDAAATDYVYLYGINNAGTNELAVAGSIFDETVVHSTTAIDATADLGNVLYSTVARTNVPVRLLGRIKIQTGAVAGEWDNAPTELYDGNIAAIPATQSEVDAGTNKTKFVTPNTLSSAIASSSQTAQVWVNFNGTGVVAIRDSFNVSSITDNATGNFTVNFTNALNNANYCTLSQTSAAQSVSVNLTGGVYVGGTSQTTTDVNILCEDANGGDTDPAMVQVAVFAN